MRMTGAGTAASLEAGAADEWLTPRRFALLLGLLIAATFPGVLLGGSTFIIRDFGLFSYPVAYFHRQSFWRGDVRAASTGKSGFASKCCRGPIHQFSGGEISSLMESHLPSEMARTDLDTVVMADADARGRTVCHAQKPWGAN